MLIVIIQNALIQIVRRLSKISSTAVADIFDGRRKLQDSYSWKRRQDNLATRQIYTEYIE